MTKLLQTKNEYVRNNHYSNTHLAELTCRPTGGERTRKKSNPHLHNISSFCRRRVTRNFLIKLIIINESQRKVEQTKYTLDK